MIEVWLRTATFLRRNRFQWIWVNASIRLGLSHRHYWSPVFLVLLLAVGDPWSTHNYPTAIEHIRMNRQLRHTVFVPVDHLDSVWDLTGPMPRQDLSTLFRHLDRVKFLVVWTFPPKHEHRYFSTWNGHLFCCIHLHDSQQQSAPEFRGCVAAMPVRWQNTHNVRFDGSWQNPTPDRWLGHVQLQTDLVNKWIAPDW